jgi:hypothetical protein
MFFSYEILPHTNLFFDRLSVLIDYDQLLKNVAVEVRRSQDFSKFERYVNVLELLEK